MRLEMKLLILLLMITPHTASALSPRFEDSEDRDAATVKFTGNIPIISIHQNGIDCSERRRWPNGRFRLDESGRIDSNATTLRIAPNKPIAFGFYKNRVKGSFMGGTIESCTVFVSFTPSPATHYAIRFDMTSMCEVELLETKEPFSSDFEPSKTPLLLRDHARKGLPKGAYCKSMQ